MRRHLILAFVTLAAIGISVPAAQARPRATPAAAACTVAGSVVTAAGLPTDQVVNFMLTDSTGTSGWVLGFTTDGAWSVSVPPANGPTSYQFVSRTWGPNGSHFTVFATCS